MITNPTPVTAATFNGMWITNLTIMLPTAERAKGVLTANLLPFDGAHLLATGGKAIQPPIKLPTADAATNTMLAALATEANRQAGNATPAALKVVQVSAPDPAKPVTAQITFVGSKPHVIKDCYALAGTDAKFAAVLNSVMVEVATLAIIHL